MNKLFTGITSGHSLTKTLDGDLSASKSHLVHRFTIHFVTRLFFKAHVTVFFLLSGCTTGTRSNLRPADTLESGQFEASAALTATARYTPSYPIVRMDYGLFEKIEIGGKLEYGSTLIGGRWGIFSSDTDDFALALGLQTGTATDLTQQDPIHSYYYHDVGVWVPSLTLGKKFSSFEPYFSYQAFLTYKNRYQTGVYKIGSRYRLTQLKSNRPKMGIFLTGEIGCAQHQMTDNSFLYLPEGALGIVLETGP